VLKFLKAQLISANAVINKRAQEHAASHPFSKTVQVHMGSSATFDFL